MVFVIFIFFNIFSLSFQGISAGFFCDDYLRGVYVVDGSNLRLIKEGHDGSWDEPYVYQNLALVPGDLVRLHCYNKETETYGAGCFYVYNKCHCFEFDIGGKPRGSEQYSRTVKLDGHDCTFTVSHLVETGFLQIYEYQHYVPLDPTELTCINTNNINNPIIVLNGVNQNIKLTNYISSSYSKKNVKNNIIKYYKSNNI